MIDLYTWPTPNGHKVHIMLEETGLAYNVIPIDINKGDQFQPDFLAISPNNKIPAIIDRDGPGGGDYALCESGAILMYLADKTGRFLPTDPRERSVTIQWSMFQMGGMGPMFGQAGHFVSRRDKPGMAAGFGRYTKEARRLMTVLDRRLAETAYVAGDAYTIADMLTFPWCQDWDKRGLEGRDYPNFMRWFEEIQARPAVLKADQVAKDVRAMAPAAE